MWRILRLPPSLIEAWSTQADIAAINTVEEGNMKRERTAALVAAGADG